MANLEIPVLRKTVSGVEEFAFAGHTPDYLVKNLSTDPILVSFESDMSNSVKILGKSYEVVFVNQSEGATDCTETNKVYVQGDGEVEVRQLWQN